MARITPVTLPKWGLEMSEGTIVAWHLDEGAQAQKGADLVDIETDKIVNTLDLSETGVLRRRLAEAGATLPVGALIAVLAAPDVSDQEVDSFVASYRPIDVSFEPKTGTEPAETAPPPAAATSSAPPQTAALTADEIKTRNAGVHASPIARRLADQLGIDLTMLAGSGRGSRISQADVEAAAAARGLGAADTAPKAATPVPAPASASPAPAPVAATSQAEFKPFTAMRRSIAQALVRSKQTVPHFYASCDVALDAALALRQQLNATTQSLRVSVNDLVLKAAALALAAEPDVNVHVLDDGVKRLPRADIAIAVAIEDGLLTPVLRDVGAKSLPEIAREARSLAERARARTLGSEDLQGGSFTVSNLGMFGVTAFDAIVNPPQAAILAVGAGRREPRPLPGGGLMFGDAMTVTLSCDHRAIDGVLAGRFLQAFRSAFEDANRLHG